jgi:hypothetical protein
LKLNSQQKELDKLSRNHETICKKELDLRNEYNRVTKNRVILDLKKNCFGSFTIAFEDKNITLSRFKHYLKISLEIENTDFEIHALKTEKAPGSSAPSTGYESTNFSEEERCSELIKIYVSFYQSEINNTKISSLLQELKRQVKNGNCRLNALNPFFIGFNYGKITMNDDEESNITLEKCMLIYREGIYLK